MTIQELLNNPETGKVVRAYVDQRITSALKTFQENHPGSPELLKRVEKVEAAAGAKIKALELKNYFIRKAFEAGIKPESLEELGVVFRDEADVDEKLKKYSLMKNDIDRQAVNRFIVDNAYQPGSGIQPETLTRRQFDKMTRAEAVALEESGQLDKLINRWSRES
ncbi:MAG: hypothetical protein AB1798_08495 [Spirochaetota bacterium]